MKFLILVIFRIGHSDFFFGLSQMKVFALAMSAIHQPSVLTSYSNNPSSLSSKTPSLALSLMTSSSFPSCSTSSPQSSKESSSYSSTYSNTPYPTTAHLEHQDPYSTKSQPSTALASS